MSQSQRRSSSSRLKLPEECLPCRPRPKSTHAATCNFSVPSLSLCVCVTCHASNLCKLWASCSTCPLHLPLPLPCPPPHALAATVERALSECIKQLSRKLLRQHGVCVIILQATLLFFFIIFRSFFSAAFVLQKFHSCK